MTSGNNAVAKSVITYREGYEVICESHLVQRMMNEVIYPVHAKRKVTKTD